MVTTPRENAPAWSGGGRSLRIPNTQPILTSMLKRALRPSSRDSNRHVSKEHGNPQMRNLIFVSSS
nr:hypothetical protein Iba_chr09aCG6460 [Ipomoea batatas]